ncbi:hypothetical protein HRG_003036 [Hirsutella rhossiliensis]|uniref:MARVEL domain-containing protein n=1 Tax=Hirsutella rhossiliensis TaxID=111463 RepID=A0A9P8N179_9HYPO|nr:uncharacterized protein HRG_03036 [Hirsutella rhossiliensis]KAH0965020.1 hypothetical protein HRG_03036 [Hirsutella rhossiliensis]
MGAKSGLALKGLQWLVRGIQFLCAALILGVYSYFLAALHNHALSIPTSARAVEGIAGAAVLYTLIGLVLLCCVAGFLFTSAIAILLDIAFVGAFIYVAVANKHGAGSCSGYLDTPFGSGHFRTACRLQTACFAVAIVAIVFFILAAFIEVALVRHHRKEKRFGPGPANNYTSGYGTKGAFAGLASRFRRKPKAQPADDANALPEHTHPTQLNGANRQSYGTETTAVGAAAAVPAHDYANKPEAGYGYQPHHGAAAAAAAGPQPQHPPPAAHQYNDGVYDRAEL